jgi:hypothetical protein
MIKVLNLIGTPLHLLNINYHIFRLINNSGHEVSSLSVAIVMTNVFQKN